MAPVRATNVVKSLLVFRHVAWSACAPKSWMSDDDDGALSGEQNAPACFQGFRVQSGKTFVENEQFGALQQRPGEAHPATLAWPSCHPVSPTNLMQAVRHSLQQRAEFQIAKHLFGQGQIFIARRPPRPISTLKASVADKI